MLALHDYNMSKTTKAKKVNIKHTANCRSTPLSFPRIMLGIADETTKTHAKAHTEIIKSTRYMSHDPN